MHIALCLDDRNGMQFNKRRLSSDKAVCKRIEEGVNGRLLVNSYSAKLFVNAGVDEEFLENAQSGDTCFVEDLHFMDFRSKIETITVYRWNRHYPSDVKLPAAFLGNWKLAEKNDFSGNSHETITEEKYTR